MLLGNCHSGWRCFHRARHPPGSRRSPGTGADVSVRRALVDQRAAGHRRRAVARDRRRADRPCTELGPGSRSPFHGELAACPGCGHVSTRRWPRRRRGRRSGSGPQGPAPSARPFTGPLKTFMARPVLGPGDTGVVARTAARHRPRATCWDSSRTHSPDRVRPLWRPRSPRRSSPPRRGRPGRRVSSISACSWRARY